MAATRSIVDPPASASRQLQRLVRDQLLNVYQRLHTRAFPQETLDDLSCMVNALCSLSNVCTTVLDDIHERGEEISVTTAVNQIKSVLKWNELLHHINIKATPSDPKFLFRAHRHVGTGEPATFVPDCRDPLDLRFKRAFSVEKFVKLLVKHLCKTQKEKDTGEKVDTCFLSMSPILEWTVHATGQRSKAQTENGTVGLAIFDVQKLRQTPGLTVFRVSDILDYLDGQEKWDLIPAELRGWARNCDEYVLMGEVHEDGLLRWVPWTDLYGSALLSTRFLRAFTLGKYRQWCDEEYYSEEPSEVNDVCQKVVEFGESLAGPQVGILLPLVKLILEPGLQFWGLRLNAEEDVVKARIYELVDEATIGGISTLTISDD